MASGNSTLAEKILDFNDSLELDPALLPVGFGVMNPFRDDPEGTIASLTRAFYHRFYNDSHPRTLLMGINPGRFGAGATGIPFTDTKRIRQDCGLDGPDFDTHEPSSVFVYEVVDAFGGPEAFYGRFYINSLCPLGFTRINKNGREVNANYYDDKSLQEAVLPFMKNKLQEQLDWGLNRDVCYCLGKGKHYAFFRKLNKKEGYFREVVPLEHPRFVVQYRWKTKHEYVEKYVRLLKGQEF